MRNAVLQKGLMLLMIILLFSVAHAQLADETFKGSWFNQDQNTGGMTKLVIKEESDNWLVRAWGKCHPEDCDWGEVQLNFVAQSVGSKEYNHAIAIWNTNFSTTYSIIRLENKQLAIETFTVFKDGSRRSNYRSFYLFSKAQ